MSYLRGSRSLWLVIVLASCGSEAPSEEPPPPPPPPGVTPNGDLCTTNNDCSSQQCYANQVGEHHCYGTGAANSPCNTTYDCNGGLCQHTHVVSSGKVCTPSTDHCNSLGVSDTCQTAILLNCEWDTDCGKLNGLTFDGCITYFCNQYKTTPPDCASMTQNMTSSYATCATVFP
jgi:hypothetical protein